MGGEGVAGLVTPLEGDRIRRNLSYPVGSPGALVGLVLDHHVAPELHPVVAPADQLVDPAQELEVDPHRAALGAGPGRAPAAEIEGLVEPGVERAAGEAGEELVEEVGQQVQAPRVGGAQAERLRPVAERVLDPLRDLGERPVAVVDQPPVQVAEAVLVRHQLDEAAPAVGVEGADVRRRQRAGLRPDLFVPPVGEGVLGVELELVELELGQQLDQAEELGERRHPAAGDVEHDAAQIEVRPVDDGEVLDRRPGRLGARPIR